MRLKAITGIVLTMLLIVVVSSIGVGVVDFDVGYALAGNTDWHTETVDSGGQVGKYTSLALDSVGNPHISYAHLTNADLKYAYYDGTWQRETVDSGGAFTSIALDSVGNPHISYDGGYPNYDLEYAYYDGTWQRETVDSGGDVGTYTSLALDSVGNPHISYYDESNDDLRYAYYDGTWWHRETVDSGGDVGRWTSIALDSGNNPHISYYDLTNADLKYAYYNGTWQRETVDSGGLVGMFTSIALDSVGNPHISYWRQIGADLKYAYYDGTWHIETVDSGGIVGAYTSLALDSVGNPHISYYDESNGDLRYAYYDGTWHIETVDSGGDVGSWTSIALDSGNNPHISYYDLTNHDLKYAFGYPPYDVTIKAYCYTEGAHVSVNISIDGSPTGYNTPYTFTGLGGPHTFTVPSTDPNYHPFIEWSTGETTTTIAVTAGGTYTAYYQALPPQDLELYPREVWNLGDPTGTQWHELHPVKSRFYNLTYWEPGVVLSPSDLIFMEPVDPSGPLEDFEVDEVTVGIMVFDEGTGIYHWLDYKCGYWTFDPEKPISTKWNEIKPDLGRCWHLTSWEDDGDGKLSFCDDIDMTPMYPFPGPVTWFHVEQVTVTIKLTSNLDDTQRYLEFMDTLDEFQAMDPIHDPISTMWNETWPEQGRIWNLSSWEDSFWFFSPSDQIVLALKDEFGEPIPGTEAEYHVDKLTVAMNLTSELDGKEHIVKFEGSLTQFMKYHWSEWEFWEGPWDTQWHEVNSNYSRQWHLSDWIDTDAIGILDYCDQILMTDKETEDEEWFHVESLSTDIIVTPKVPEHDVAVTNVTPSKTVVGQGYNMSLNVTVENLGDFPETFNVTAYYSNETLTPEQWETFWSGGDVNRDGYIDDIDGALIDAAWGSNSSDPNWNPDADLDQDGEVSLSDLLIWSYNYSWEIWSYFNILGGRIGTQTINDLSSGNSTTLVFTWNTTGVPYDNYIISAKATRILGETHTADNILVDGTVFVTIIGDVDGDGTVDTSDLSDLSKAYGSSLGDPNWNPNCDLNNDGKVDASDLFDSSKNYGKTI